MEIIKKIATLKKSVEKTDELVDKLLSYLEVQKLQVINKEKKITSLKDEVSNNIDKIDKIIEKNNANS